MPLETRAVPALLVCLGIVALLCALGACGDDERDAPPRSIAETLGLTQYAGAIDPIELSDDGPVTTYRFDPAQGPQCMRGAEYRASVRESDSNDLVIFLQGGGACWSAFCLAVTAAPEGIPTVDIMNPQLPENPVADWNVVYLPYCDGSFFAGDAEHDDNLNGNGRRIHRGLANLTAALEMAKLHFPAPDRIVLAGSSGGAYGLLLGGPLVRYYYPDTELILMADSGIGLGANGAPDTMQTILDEFNLTRFLPEDCPTCLDGGHLTGLIGYFLDRDPNVRVGTYSSWYDSVLATTFLHVPAEEFAEALRTQTDRIHAAHPNRFRRFITDGIQHTSLLGDATGIIGSDLGAVELPPDSLGELLGGNLVIGSLATTEIDGLTMADWLSALIDDDRDTWIDLLEERGPAPETE